jgi:hypothetical protein
MAMRSSDPALGNRLISQYEMFKHLCDRLKYPGKTLAILSWMPIMAGTLATW